MSHTPEQLRNLLHRHAGRPVFLTITRNRVSIASVKFPLLAGPVVRLNRIFLVAPDAVLEALGRYLCCRNTREWRVVSEFVAAHTPEPVLLSTATPLMAKGRVFDLERVRDRVNSLYFEGRVNCRVGWAKPGRQQRRGRTRSIRFGTYNRQLNVIRINPVLDDDRVPPEFMNYIVFHEMLHAVIPSQHNRGRWRHHHGSFRILERRFPEHDAMQALAKKLVVLLGT